MKKENQTSKAFLQTLGIQAVMISLYMRRQNTKRIEWAKQQNQKPPSSYGKQKTKKTVTFSRAKTHKF